MFASALRVNEASAFRSCKGIWQVKMAVEGNGKIPKSIDRAVESAEQGDQTKDQGRSISPFAGKGKAMKPSAPRLPVDSNPSSINAMNMRKTPAIARTAGPFLWFEDYAVSGD